MFWSEEYKFGFVFLSNGAHEGYRHSKGHAFYNIEEEVMSVLFPKYLAKYVEKK
jgi:hypothetical protein